MVRSITDSIDMSLGKLWETVKDREARHAAVHRVAKSQTEQQLNNKTDSFVRLTNTSGAIRTVI